MTELKPCPFCGGEAEICPDVDSIMGKYWYIRCKKCYCRGTGIYESDRKLEPQEEYAAITGAWEKAIEAWNRRVTIEPDQQWIPCSPETMPEEDEQVFVYLFDDSPYIAWFCGGRWHTEEFTLDKDEEPVAWMPLPTQYEGGRKE